MSWSVIQKRKNAVVKVSKGSYDWNILPIFKTADSSATELCLMGHHHKPECLVKKYYCQGQSKTSKCQWMLVQTISSEPLNLLLPNLVWWSIVMSKSAFQSGLLSSRLVSVGTLRPVNHKGLHQRWARTSIYLSSYSFHKSFLPNHNSNSIHNFGTQNHTHTQKKKDHVLEPICIPRALDTRTCIEQSDLFYSVGLHSNWY